MIRDLTKSALSLSWALSLLGIKQSVNLIQPSQQGRGDVFMPIAQTAADQLDESVKGIFRTGDNMQRGMVDMAFSLLNPTGWVNPRTWTNMAGAANPGNWAGASGGAGKGVASMMNPMNWMNPANFMRSMNDCGGQPPRGAQPPNPPPSQPARQTANGPTSGTPAAGAPAASAPITSASPAPGWGPMPSNS